MATPGPLPFMDFNDVEVANAARTIEYLRSGLANTMQGHWMIGPGRLCGVLYRLDSSSCAPTTFTSPALDPAPWYAVTQPGSGTFLGLIMLDLKGYDSVRTRVVTDKIQGLGGASFSGERRNPRTWRFRAALVSADDIGAEYGLRWLESVLGTGSCDNCDTGTLTVRISCPSDTCADDTLGEWLAYDTVLTNGPIEVETWSPRPFDDVMGGCRDLVIVEWEMASGNPFLYKRPQLALAAETIGTFSACTDICDFFFGDPGTPHCVSVPTPASGQTIAPIFSFQSTSGMGDVIIGAYITCPTGTDDGSPLALMQLSGIPAGGTLVVDCAKRTITLTTADPDLPGSFITEDASGLLVLDGDTGVQWPEANDCNGVRCFCARTAHPASQGGDTTVQIETQVREG